MTTMNPMARGFTLIELLVVIAIVGILSSVLMSSLNTARAKGSDAKTKSQLSSLRSAAEIYQISNGNYGSVATDSCTDVVPDFFEDAASGMLQYTTQVPNYPAGATLSCHTDGTAYAVSALLLSSSTGEAWCVDSAGSSKLIPTNLGIGQVACP